MSILEYPLKYNFEAVISITEWPTQCSETYLLYRIKEEMYTKG